MIQPLHDYVLIKVTKQKSQVVSVGDVEDTEQFGEVLAVGAGVHYNGTFVQPSVKPGDKICFQKHKYNAETPQKLLDQDLAIIRDAHVIYVETEEK